MGILKRTLFTIIPIATILIALAYGIEAIFGMNLTYLGWTSPSGTEYPNVYDFASYLSALQFDNVAKPFENLGNSFDIIIQPVKAIGKIFEDGYDLGDGIKTIANIGILLVNFVIWLIDMLISIVQIAVLLIAKFFNLFGINTKANFSIFNIFRAFTDFELINGINALI